jgi:hypothetical protein
MDPVQLLFARALALKAVKKAYAIMKSRIFKIKPLLVVVAMALGKSLVI